MLNRRNFVASIMASPLAAWLGGHVGGRVHRLGSGLSQPHDIDGLGLRSGDTIVFEEGPHLISSGIDPARIEAMRNYPSWQPNGGCFWYEENELF